MVLFSLSLQTDFELEGVRVLKLDNKYQSGTYRSVPPWLFRALLICIVGVAVGEGDLIKTCYSLAFEDFIEQCQTRTCPPFRTTAVFEAPGVS